MMVKSKNKSLLIAVLALITCCVFAIAGIGATNAAAWYEWDKHDPPIITPEQLADSSWDGNGWRTTVEASAWKFGVADYKGINETTGFTEVTLQNQSAFLNRSELDITGGKAVKFTMKTTAADLWFTLATKEMYESGRRLSGRINDAMGMPLSFGVQTKDNKNSVKHADKNGFSSEKTVMTDLDATQTHEVYIYAGTGGDDFSFVMIDGKAFKADTLKSSVFKVDEAYLAYLYLYGDGGGSLEISAPEVAEKPELPYIDMQAEMRLDMGETATIDYTPNDKLEQDYPNGPYKWSSSNTAVATVDETTGVITPVSGGTATIKCCVTDGDSEVVSAECLLTVCGYDERSGWLTNESNRGAAWQKPSIVKDSYSYDEATKITKFTTGDATATWNKTALDLDNGAVHFKVKIGGAENAEAKTMFNFMNQTQRDGLANVKDGNPGKIAFYYGLTEVKTEVAQVSAADKEKTFPVAVDEEAEVIVYVGGGEENDKSFVYINGVKIDYNATLADFETNGKHVAYLGLWALNGHRDFAISEIKTGTAVILDTAETAMTVNSEKTLAAQVISKGETAPAVSWSSSDTSVVSVENGKIRALKPGTAIVTVTADGYSAACTVEVSHVTVESVTLDKLSAEIKVGETLTLTAAYSPENVTEEVTFEWSNGGKNSVATYEVASDNSGKITVTAVGEGIVTVTVDCNGKTAQCIITVKAADKPAEPEKSGCGGSLSGGGDFSHCPCNASRRRCPHRHKIQEESKQVTRKANVRRMPNGGYSVRHATARYKKE